MSDKPVNVKVTSDDSFGVCMLVIVLAILLFHGEPSISESLRVILAQAAGLKP